MTTTAGVALGSHTLEDWHAVDQPADGSRLELLAGSWLVDPQPPLQHQYAGDEPRRALADALAAAERTDLVVTTAVGTALSTERRDGLVPDVVVCDRTSPSVVTPEHLHLVVEVWSPGNTRRERADEKAAYVAAGVPSFWEVEQDDAGPLLLTAHRLVEGAHRVAATVRRGDGPVVVDAAPAPTTVDLARLLL